MANTVSSTFDITSFTNNATIVASSDIDDQRTFEVKGDGNFDKLMETVRKHLDALLLSRCITKEEYASLYVDMMKTNLQIVLLAEEKGWDNAVKKRQIQGFNESFKKDMLKIMIDGWTVGFSASEEAFFLDGDSDKAIPYPLTYDAITNLYKDFICSIPSKDSAGNNVYDKSEFDDPIRMSKEETQSPV